MNRTHVLAELLSRRGPIPFAVALEAARRLLGYIDVIARVDHLDATGRWTVEGDLARDRAEANLRAAIVNIAWPQKSPIRLFRGRLDRRSLSIRFADGYRFKFY